MARQPQSDLTGPALAAASRPVAEVPPGCEPSPWRDNRSRISLAAAVGSHWPPQQSDLTAPKTGRELPAVGHWPPHRARLRKCRRAASPVRGATTAVGSHWRDSRISLARQPQSDLPSDLPDLRAPRFRKCRRAASRIRGATTAVGSPHPAHAVGSPHPAHAELSVCQLLVGFKERGKMLIDAEHTVLGGGSRGVV